MGIDLNENIGCFCVQDKVKRSVTVKEALEILIQEESEN